MFFRLHTDGTREPVALESAFGGGFPAHCWIIGGGPSLAAMPIEDIVRSPAPKFALNLAGSGLLRPNFWTSYDPTSRFQRSIYLDASVIKFVHRCRAMDLVPESTFKVCESPATFFFERDRNRGFAGFAEPRSTGIVDWQDSLVQAIDIAFRLGFRRLLLAGCEMFIPPSDALQRAAAVRDVRYHPRELLRDFLRRCEQVGMQRAELEAYSTGEQYHFDERKPLAAAVQTDFHYFRVAQYLRLSRRALTLAGLELVSVTPQSRLNDCFRFVESEQMLEEIRRTIGDPACETTFGRYSGSSCRTPEDLGPMRDFPPHFWPAKPTPAPPNPSLAAASGSRRRLQAALDALPDIPVDLNERG